MTSTSLEIKYLPIAVWKVLKESKRSIEINNAALELFDYSADDFLLTTLDDLLLANESENFLDKVQNRHQQDAGIWIFRESDGSPLYLHISTVEISDHDEHSFLIFAQDQTEQKVLIDHLESEMDFRQLILHDMP